MGLCVSSDPTVTYEVAHEITCKDYKALSKKRSLSANVARGMPEQPPQFTRKEKEIVRNSWDILNPELKIFQENIYQSIKELNPHLCENLSNPEPSEVFADMEQNKLSWHVFKILSVIDDSMSVLFQDDKLENLFQNLGFKHALMDVGKEYIDLFVPAFFNVIDKDLGIHFTRECECAWTNYFRFASYFLKNGLLF